MTVHSGGSTGGRDGGVPPQMKLCPRRLPPPPIQTRHEICIATAVSVAPTYLACHPTGPQSSKARAAIDCSVFVVNMQVTVGWATG